MPGRLSETRQKVVGVKQAVKAVHAGEAAVVYIAKDADHRVVAPLKNAATAAGVSIVLVDSMRLLGRLCEIEVGAAAAALVKAKGAAV